MGFVKNMIHVASPRGTRIHSFDLSLDFHSAFYHFQQEIGKRFLNSCLQLRFSNRIEEKGLTPKGVTTYHQVNGMSVMFCPHVLMFIAPLQEVNFFDSILYGFLNHIGSKHKAKAVFVQRRVKTSLIVIYLVPVAVI